jgi:hypothetical protein
MSAVKPSALAVVPRSNATAMESMSLDETLTLGKVLAESGFFKDAKSASQAVAKILAGRELGFGPMASMSGIFIIEGKPSISGLLIASAIKASGKYDYRIVQHDQQGCELAVFEAGEKVGSVTFTAKDAETAGLIDGPNKHTWRKYREDMLFYRAISRAARRYTPDIFKGPVYTPEELGAALDTSTGEYIPTATSERLLADTKSAPVAGSAPVKNVTPAEDERASLNREIGLSISTLKSAGHPSFRNGDGQQKARILEYLRNIASNRDWPYETLHSLGDLSIEHLGVFAGILEGEIQAIKEERAESTTDPNSDIGI